MTPHLRYVVYVARHKLFVLIAGLRTGTPPWRLMVHDWSKLTRAEWCPYVDKFMRDEPTDDAEHVARKAAFKSAWKHHYESNKHHWQYWLIKPVWRGSPTATDMLVAQEMPKSYVREMVADWMGAGRAITGRWEIGEWYDENGPKMNLHPRTRVLVEQIVERMR